ncbi:MAG: SEC-C domain-containing protein [Chloroflexota bacterium]
MSNKPGRNDPCWCGSGKKYKFCHYRRDKREAASVQDVIEATQQGIKKRECLHPEAPINCKGEIVQAHTIQRNGGLSKIAKHGHVYTPFTTVPSVGKKHRMRREGIKRASTFTGFCKYHDNLVFAPIEDHPLQINQHHALLLTFRAISREIYTKRRAIEMIPFGKSLDRGKDLLTQAYIQENFSDYQYGAEAGLRDLNHYKALLDKALLSQKYQDIHYYAIKIDQTPDVLCSGALFPDCDFSGNSIQNLMQGIETKEPVDCIAFSLLATDYGGVVFFSWIGEGKVNREFIRSLSALHDNEICHAVLRFTFEYFENTYLSPEWWESLSKDTQDRIMDRYLASMDIHQERSSKVLKDDGMRLITWNVISRETNITLD